MNLVASCTCRVQTYTDSEPTTAHSGQMLSLFLGPVAVPKLAPCSWVDAVPIHRWIKYLWNLRRNAV